MPIDYYQMLGIGPSASKAEIRHAFLKLARSLHPDVNPDPDAAEQFKRITAAYDAILEGAAEVRESPSEASDGFATQQNYASARRRGEDIEVTLSLTLKETFSSVTRDVLVTTTEVCYDCAGQGFLDSAPCLRCRGEGRVEVRRVIKVEIPSGASVDEMLHFPGKGNAGVRGGEPGDLDVKISVKPDPFFARTGDDLTCTLSVPMTDAVLGGTVSFVSYDGSVDVTVAAGMQGGEVLSFPQRGFSHAAGGRGELHVTVSVEIPQDLSPRERQMMEWFRDIRADEGFGVIALQATD